MDAMAKVTEILCETLGVDASRVKLGSHLVTDLGADSLDSVEVVMMLEESLDIEFSDQESENIRTVGQLVEIVEKKINKTA